MVRGIPVWRWLRYVFPAVVILNLLFSSVVSARMRLTPDEALGDIGAQTLFTVANTIDSSGSYNVTDIQINSRITVQDLQLDSLYMGHYDRTTKGTGWDIDMDSGGGGGPLVLGPSSDALIFNGLRIQLARDNSGNFLFLRFGTDDLSGKILTNSMIQSWSYNGTINGTPQNGSRINGTSISSLTFGPSSTAQTNFYLSLSNYINIAGIGDNSDTALRINATNLFDMIPGMGWWLSFQNATSP